MNASSKYLIALLLLFAVIAQGQTDSLDCRAIQAEWYQKTEGTHYLDFSIELIGGLEEFNKAIPYPVEAMKAGIEGTVYVKCFVDTAGVPECLTIIKGLGHGCDEAALVAVQRARFKVKFPRQFRFMVITVPVRYGSKRN